MYNLRGKGASFSFVTTGILHEPSSPSKYYCRELERFSPWVAPVYSTVISSRSERNLLSLSPRTMSRCSGRRNGPYFSRCSTIRWANPLPIPGSVSSSAAEAVLILMRGRAGSCESDWTVVAGLVGGWFNELVSCWRLTQANPRTSVANESRTSVDFVVGDPNTVIVSHSHFRECKFLSEKTSRDVARECNSLEVLRRQKVVTCNWAILTNFSTEHVEASKTI